MAPPRFPALFAATLLLVAGASGLLIENYCAHPVTVSMAFVDDDASISCAVYDVMLLPGFYTDYFPSSDVNTSKQTFILVDTNASDYVLGKDVTYVQPLGLLDSVDDQGPCADKMESVAYTHTPVDGTVRLCADPGAVTLVNNCGTFFQVSTASVSPETGAVTCTPPFTLIDGSSLDLPAHDYVLLSGGDLYASSEMQFVRHVAWMLLGSSADASCEPSWGAGGFIVEAGTVQMCSSVPEPAPVSSTPVSSTPVSSTPVSSTQPGTQSATTPPPPAECYRKSTDYGVEYCGSPPRSTPVKVVNNCKNAATIMGGSMGGGLGRTLWCMMPMTLVPGNSTVISGTWGEPGYDILLVSGADHIPDGVIVRTLESFGAPSTGCMEGAGAYWSTGDTVRLCGGDLNPVTEAPPPVSSASDLPRAFAVIATALAFVLIVV